MKCRCSLSSKDVGAPCDTICSLHHTHTPQLRRRHLKDTDGKIEAVSLHSPSNTTPNDQYLSDSLFQQPLTPTDHAAQSEARSLLQTGAPTPVSTHSRHTFSFSLTRTNKQQSKPSCLFPLRERKKKKKKKKKVKLPKARTGSAVLLLLPFFARTQLPVIFASFVQPERKEQSHD